MVTLDELGKGLDGGVYAFVITDIYSGLRAAFPAPDKSADSTTMTIRTFAGTRPIHKLYADRSGEISRALKNLSIMPQCSQLGLPQTNAVAERANGDILAGTRSLLLAAGLPHYFLEYAMKCFCILDNIGRVDGEGESPWSRTHGRAFKGKFVPFGSKVFSRQRRTGSRNRNSRTQPSLEYLLDMRPHLDMDGLVSTWPGVWRILQGWIFGRIHTTLLGGDWFPTSVGSWRKPRRALSIR